MNEQKEKESDPLEMFLYAINSAETKKKYRNKLDTFFEFAGINGNLEEKARQFVSKGTDDSNWVLASVMKFITFQKDRAERSEITYGTVANYYKPIKLFCDMNDIAINWKKISKGIPKSRKSSNDRAPTIEEIRKLVEYPDRRIKSIVYLMCSSGIRLGAWDYLKWKNITLIEQNGNIISAKVIVYDGDAEEYYTFITPEAYGELKQWMEFRKDSGEDITGESWVMRDMWDAEDNGKGFARYPKKLKSSGIKSLIERALNAQQIRKKLSHGEKRHEFKVNHGFRKFFKTRAEQNMKPINVEMLQGHSIGISDSYYKPTEQELLNDYLTAIPSLQISEVFQVRKEFAESEKTWVSQFDSISHRIETLESSVQVLTSLILVAKTNILQEAHQD